MSGRGGNNQGNNGKNREYREYSGGGGGRDDSRVRFQSDNKSNYSDNSGAKHRNNYNKSNYPNDGGAKPYKGNDNSKKPNNYSRTEYYSNNKSYYHENPMVKLSKSLSSVLRHNALREGLKIEPDGYAKVDDLLKLPRFRGTTLEHITLIVEENDKQRFTLVKRSEIWWIRANQGHSLEVKDLDLEKITDPSTVPQVIHGTYSDKWGSIKSQGLSRMSRNHIHFAIGRWGDTNVTSGMRANCDLFIYANVSKAMKDGINFYKSSNGVILTEGINGKLDKEYFLKVVDGSGKTLYSDETPGENNNKNVGGNKNAGGNNVNNKNAGGNNVNVQDVDGNNVIIKDADGKDVNNRGNNNARSAKKSWSEVAKNNVGNKNKNVWNNNNVGNNKNAEIKNAEIKNAEIKNAEIKNAEIKNAEIKNAEIKNAEIKNAEIKNAEIKNAEIKNAEIKNAEIKNAEIKNAGNDNNNGKRKSDNKDVNDGKKVFSYADAAKRHK